MIKKFSFNAFYIIFAVFSVWISAAGFLNAAGNTAANFVLLLFAAAVLLAVCVTLVRLPEISPKAYRVAVTAIFAVYTVCLVLFGTTTMTAHISDLRVLVQAADYWLEHGDIVHYSGYFTVCRNTLGNAIFIYLMYIPMHLLGIDIFSNTAESWGIAVNCLMIVLAVFFLYRIAVRILKNRNCEILFLLLCCVYLPFYLWAHRYYSDTLSLPFLTASLWLFLKSRECCGKKKVLYALICGVCLWAGYFIRGSLVIALVAIVLFSAFCDKKDFVKSGLAVLIAFIITLTGWNSYVNHNSWIDYSNTQENEYPLTMWLMYGAHGEGNYNDDDVNYLQSLPAGQRPEAAKEKLKEYYSQYNFKSYLEFLTLKYGITYGNGLFDAELYLNNQRSSNFTHQFLIEGMPLFAPFRYIANALHFAVLALAAVSGFINWRKKEWNVPMLMHIALLGNIIFFSFWETKARYAFGITPILLILCIYTLYETAKFAERKTNKNR